MRLLSDTYPSSTHAKRMAEATSSPWPAGNRLLQELGLLAFTLDQVERIMPTKGARGRASRASNKPRIGESPAGGRASRMSTAASHACGGHY